MVPTIVLDPYLLITISRTISTSALYSCDKARFVISDHYSPEGFLPREYAHFIEAIAREKVEAHSVSALCLAHVMPLRASLTMNQISTIATAYCHNYFFATDCSV